MTIVDGKLEWQERPDPEPGVGEVLVAVRSAGINAGDLLQLAGHYPAPPGSPPDVPGLELAGEVVALGPGATRYAEVVIAERESWTMAGICQARDVLGLVDGDVAVIGTDVTVTAAAVVDRMLAAGGEMVTLVLGDDAPADVVEHVEGRVREGYLAVDTVVYRGGRQGALLLIGVE